MTAPAPAGRRGAAARSYLYVPADRPDRLMRATERGADALILDLEDAVAAGAKEGARRELAHWLAGQREPGCELWIRINPEQAAADIAATVTTEVAGVVVPKAEPPLLRDVDQLLSARERSIGTPPGQFRVLPLIESGRGLLAAAELASQPRAARLGIGEVDLIADLRMEPGPGRDELLPLRLQVVTACAAARIGAPVAATSTDFRDLAVFRQSTQALVRIGFRARTAIHPAQIATINEILSPSAQDVARAARLVAAFEAARKRGDAVTRDEDGRMVDVAVVRAAREVLARAAGSPGPDSQP